MLSLQEMMVILGIATTDPSLPMDKPKTVGVNPTQAMCLADNVYFEARNQGTAGWSAVISVTLNRVKDKRFPNTVCEVVKQGPTRESWKKNGTYYPIRNRCQFSWFCDGKSDEPKEPTTYKRLLDLALVLVYDDIQIVDFTEGATHYHADYVYPEWRKSKTKTVEIADHIFYRWEK